MGKLSKKAATVLNYLQMHIGEDVTVQQIAKAVGMSINEANGIVTNLCREDRGGYAVKELKPETKERFVRLTSHGSQVNPFEE